MVVKDNQPVPYELITIGTYLRINSIHSTIWTTPSEYEIVNTTYTGTDGLFKMSFLGGNYVYKLEIQKYEYVLLDGKLNRSNYLTNLGEIDLTEKQENEK